MLADRIGAVTSAVSKSLGTSTDIANRAFDIGRVLVALAQLSLLLTTPTSNMFVPVGEQPALARCATSWSLSAFCWAPPDLVRWLFVGALVLIVLGFAPRITSWVHLYVALSIVLAIDLPEGGDQAAVAITVCIALISLSDTRYWAWSRSREPDSFGGRLYGLSWAAHWLLRVQMAYIYLNSSISKMSVEAWQDGSAVYYVTRMEYFGVTGPLASLMREVTAIPLLAVAATWGTMITELAIAVLILCSRSWQRLAFILAAALHIMIILMIGLGSFGLVMIGGVLAATSLAWNTTSFRRSAPYPDMSAPPARSGASTTEISNG
ncbi:sporulation-delaying protein SdpB family protein [Arthrobacter sp. CP30]